MAEQRCLEPAQTLEDLIRGIRILFEDDNINVEEVQAFMESYKSNPGEWASYAMFDPHRYTRNLVDEGNGKYNLIVLCWSEGQGSSIHDHADSHCFMKVLDGELQETKFAWPSKQDHKKPMEVTGTKLYERDQVTYINDSVGLHRVENVSHSDVAVSLHLYIPPIEICRTFDQRTGHKRKCQVTFWSKFGARTPFTSSSDQPDGK